MYLQLIKTGSLKPPTAGRDRQADVEFPEAIEFRDDNEES